VPGVSFAFWEITGKWFELLKRIVPGVTRVAALGNTLRAALLVLPHPMFYADRAHMEGLATMNRWPGAYWGREFVELGGLFAHPPSPVEMAGHGAVYVDKILKGAKPADLPVEQPTKFELVINLKTAKTLGLTIPQSMLLRADEVLQ